MVPARAEFDIVYEKAFGAPRKLRAFYSPGPMTRALMLSALTRFKQSYRTMKEHMQEPFQSCITIQWLPTAVWCQEI